MTLIDIKNIAEPSDVIPFFGLSELAPENSGRMFTRSGLQILIDGRLSEIKNTLIDLNYKTAFQANSNLYYLLKILCVESVCVDLWRTIGMSLINRWLVTYKTFDSLHKAIDSAFQSDLFLNAFRAEESDVILFAETADIISQSPGYGKNSTYASPSLSDINELIKYGSAVASACCEENRYNYKSAVKNDQIYETINRFVVAYARGLFLRARSYSSYDPENSGTVMGEIAVPFEEESRKLFAMLIDSSPISSFVVAQ